LCKRGKPDILCNEISVNTATDIRCTPFSLFACPIGTNTEQRGVNQFCWRQFKRKANKMAQGTVKWFSAQKGFGFIMQDDGSDVFVHHSVVQGGATLQEGQRCTFDVQQSPKGLQAANVVPGEVDPNYTPRERPRRERSSFGFGGGGRGFGGGGGGGGGRRRDDRYSRDRGGKRRF
jgi:CspA family cold shock protein